jgi:hypothetical protein
MHAFRPFGDVAGLRSAEPPLDGAFQRHDVVVGLDADVAILEERFADET